MPIKLLVIIELCQMIINVVAQDLDNNHIEDNPIDQIRTALDKIETFAKEQPKESEFLAADPINKKAC